MQLYIMQKAPNLGFNFIRTLQCFKFIRCSQRELNSISSQGFNHQYIDVTLVYVVGC